MFGIEKNDLNATLYQRWDYKKHFYINATITEKHKIEVTLEEKIYIHKLGGYDITLSEMRQIWEPKWQCYKISSKHSNTGDNVNFQTFRLQIAIHFFSEEIDLWKFPSVAHILVSSEPNSFGIGWKRWFDGAVEPFKGIRRNLIGNFPLLYSLHVYEVNEYMSINSQCSDQSYYECLASRFISHEIQTKINSNQELCSPFSLPTIGNVSLPICEDDRSQSYFKRILIKLQNNQVKYCMKTCNVKEYKTKVSRQFDRTTYYKSIQYNPILVELMFKKPASTSNHRSMQPYKTVNTEGYIISGFTLVGSVGGQMGLFAGLSIKSILDSLVRAVANVKVLSKKYHEKYNSGRVFDKETGKWLLGGITYNGLLISAIIFSAKNIQDYMDERKDYSISQELLSPADIPALVLCWELSYINKTTYELETLEPLKYSRDLLFKAKVSEQRTTTLLQNMYTPVQLGLELRLKELKLGEKLNIYQCYQIATRWQGHGNIDMKDFNITLALNFSSRYSNVFHANKDYIIHITSEQNSYGLTKGKWFDGKVYGQDVESFSWISNHQSVDIFSVKEYRNLPYTCSNESYYECLARRFEDIALDEASQQYHNGIKCTLDAKCLPFSLPETGKTNIPICMNDREKACYVDMLSQLMSNQDTYCKRLCNVKEYKFTVRGSLGVHEKFKGLVFSYKFSSPSTSRNLRSWMPVKTVKKEYLVITFKSLVGTIGGTLGMFVGFSFIGTAEVLIEYLLKFWKRKVNGTSEINPISKT